MQDALGSPKTDPDYIPWQLGLSAFLIMVFVFGMLLGSLVNRPLAGGLVSIGIWATICICGLTHDRIRHGRWIY